MMPARVLMAMLLVGLPAAVTAQGLGDAAKTERARRARQDSAGGEPATVLTNEDLKRGSASPGDGAKAAQAGSPAANVATRPAPAPGPAPTPVVVNEGPTPLEERRAREQQFEAAIAAARVRVQQVQARLEELQAKLNPMSTAFIFGPMGSNNTNEELSTRAELQQGPARLAEAAAAVADAEQALADFRRGRTDVRPGGSRGVPDPPPDPE
jgi:hypothetical protein